MSLAERNQAWLELMRCGQCEAAWRISDELQALHADIDCSGWPRHQQFIWDGSPLAGKRVLVRCYHGLGDTVQFVRFAARLAAIASSVVLWVQPLLVPLLRQLRGIEVMPLHNGSPEVEYDVDIELSELMHAFRIHVNSLGQDVPYLHTRPRRVGQRARFAAGLVWAAGEWQACRSVPCELFSQLGEIQNVDWLILQRGPGLQQWSGAFGRVPHIKDVSDEAAVLCGLDVLITVDTFSAHLAGAHGVPVWMLLPTDADWRWMRDRADTPWYPSMQLFRQTEPGEWHEPIAQIKRKLRLSHSSKLHLDEE